MTRRLGPLLVPLGALALWALVSAAVNGRGGIGALPYAVAAASLALGAWLGLMAAGATAWLALVTTAVFLVAEATIGHPWSGALGGLLHYANAEAALAVQLAALPLLAAAVTRRRPLAWWVASAIVVGVSVLSRSAAGMLLGAMLLVVGGLALRPRPPRARWATAVGGGVVLAFGSAQLLLTASSSWPATVASALSRRRIDLWQDALSIQGSSPAVGRGPGSFAELSPTAADPDTTAAHSVLMQVLAELGIVGAAILGAVFISGLWMLGTAPVRSRLIGVAAWCVLWLHGLVDYVMHFPAVVLAGGCVLGAAAGTRAAAAERHATDSDFAPSHG